MNKTVEKIKLVRTDLSDYLFHFTKGKKAMETLMNIINDGSIKDINKNGFICFTEAPLFSLVDMFKIFGEYKNPMYAPYGIAVLKSTIYEMGGRPVIYGSKKERKFIHPKLQWRYVEYEPYSDYTWLREWRLSEDLKINPLDNYLITNTVEEELVIAHEEGDIEIDGDYADGEFHPSYYLLMKKQWKSISIERITKEIMKSNGDLKRWIDIQEIGAEESIYLGS